MKPSQLIDKRIAEFPNWKWEIFKQLRKIILESDPTIEEGWKWDTAVWSHQGLVCAVGVFKAGVKLNFFQGASITDPDKLFNAGLESKKMRSIDFKEGDKIRVLQLKKLIKNAVEFNTKTL